MSLLINLVESLSFLLLAALVVTVIAPWIDQRPILRQGAIGALFALAVGLRGHDVAHVAAWSATSYGIAGGVEGSYEQRAIVSRCLEGRGYNVIAD